MRPSFAPSAVPGLAAMMHGPLVGPDDPDYEAARRPHDAVTDERPALIAYCTDAADVAAAVNFGRDHGLDIAVRGGGHHGLGLGSCDGGLVIDLSRMRCVRVDPDARLAYAGGGATLADLDHATQQFGLAVPTGIVSTTGLAGLTLGGGFGYLSRAYGLTIDNLRVVDVVLADGSFVTASAERNTDLFWAVRGGGGNLGVVTSLTFALHPLATVVGGPTLWPLDAAVEVLAFYREFLADAPRELGGSLAFLVAPPDPALPSALHLRPMCGVVWCYSGPPERADAALAAVRDVPGLVLDGIQPLPLAALQGMADVLYPPGLRWSWRADFVNELSDEAVALHAEYGSRLPSRYASMHLHPVDGAVHDVAGDETAFGYRDAAWAQVISVADPDPAGAPSTSATWAADYANALYPRSTAGGAVAGQGDARVRATYRDNHERLRQIKARYDPTNLFHLNQNIPPRLDRAATRAEQ